MKPLPKMKPPLTFSMILAACLAFSACRSRVVHVNLVNTSLQPLYTITVDYPGASFGVNQLNPGKTYQYPIKPQDTGALKIQFTDANGHTHNVSGPELHQNDEGMLDVKLDQEKAVAKLQAGAH